MKEAPACEAKKKKAGKRFVNKIWTVVIELQRAFLTDFIKDEITDLYTEIGLAADLSSEIDSKRDPEPWKFPERALACLLSS